MIIKYITQILWWVRHIPLQACRDNMVTEHKAWNPRFLTYITPKHSCLLCKRVVINGKVYPESPPPPPPSTTKSIKQHL
jgi:hypothetical protein